MRKCLLWVERGEYCYCLWRMKLEVLVVGAAVEWRKK